MSLFLVTKTQIQASYQKKLMQVMVQIQSNTCIYSILSGYNIIINCAYRQKTYIKASGEYFSFSAVFFMQSNTMTYRLNINSKQFHFY